MLAYSSTALSAIVTFEVQLEIGSSNSKTGKIVAEKTDDVLASFVKTEFTTPDELDK